jgi:hypothetical protein
LDLIKDSQVSSKISFVSDRFGKENKALALNGAFLSIPRGGPDAFSKGVVNTNIDAFTFTSWIFAPTQMTEARLIDCGNGQSDNIIIGLNSNDGNRPYFSILSGTTNPQRIEFTVPATFRLDKWAHIGVTYSSFSNNICLYLNGGLLSPCVKLLANAKYIERINCYIGKSNGNGKFGNFADMVGVVDELKVYNVELTSAQILEDMYYQNHHRQSDKSK